MAGYDRITPEGRRFLGELEELAMLEVFVGYQHGEAAEENGADLMEVAAFNELGTSAIPSRPFIRNAFDHNADKINAMYERQAGKIANGGTAEDCLKEMGEYGVRLIQEEIREGDFTPNAPTTIRRKGSDKPLIDTGRMRQSVHYVIRRKGAGT